MTLSNETIELIEKEVEKKFPFTPALNGSGEPIEQRVGQNPHGSKKHKVHNRKVVDIVISIFASVKGEEWVDVNDRLPDMGRLVELCTTHGANDYAKSLEVYKVENAHQTNRTLYYRGTVSKSTWDLKEWSHWRYYNDKDLPTPPKTK